MRSPEVAGSLFTSVTLYHLLHSVEHHFRWLFTSLLKVLLIFTLHLTADFLPYDFPSKHFPLDMLALEGA